MGEKRDVRLGDALRCYMLYLRNYHVSEIQKLASTRKISRATVYRYIAWVRKDFPTRAELDSLVRTMQSILRQIDVEYHNMPEKSSQRLRALGLQMTNVMQTSRLLGITPTEPASEPEPYPRDQMVKLSEVVELLRSLPLEMQQKAFEIIKEKKIFDRKPNAG